MTSPLDVLLGAQVKDDGVAVTPRRYIDFRTGLTIADDPATDSIRVSATGGGGGALVGDVNGAADANVVTKITGDTGDVEMIASSLSWGSPGNSQLKVNAVDGAIELWNNAILALKAHATAPTIANTGAITQIIGGVRHSVRTISSNIALDSTTKDFIGWVDASAPRTITLPTPSSGRTFLLVNVGASAVTIARSASELINGVAANYVVPVANCIVQIVTNGTDWFALPLFDITTALAAYAKIGGGDLNGTGGTSAAPRVSGLTGISNIVAMHGTQILADVGAGGRIDFSASGVSVPAGTLSVGSNTAKVLLDSYGAFGATHSAVWLGTAAATDANVALAGNNTTTTINANTAVQVAQGGTVSANFQSAGLRIGDATVASEKLDVVGRAKVGVGASKVTIDGYPTTEATQSAVWLGPDAPTGSNYALVGSGSQTILNGNGNLYFALSNNIKGSWTTNGLRVGDLNGAAEALDIIGNIKIARDTASKVYQQDNTTNSFLGSTFTFQAANATGTNSVGSRAVIAGGTGTSAAGGVDLNAGATTILSVGPTGATVGTTTSTHQIIGAVRKTFRNVTGNITIDTTTTDNYLLVDTSAARSITLPAATAGRSIKVKDKTGSANTNNITIVRAGSEAIDGVAANYVYATNWGAFELFCDGTNWFIL